MLTINNWRTKNSDFMYSLEEKLEAAWQFMHKILLIKHTLFSGMVPICNIFSYLFGSKNETE